MISSCERPQGIRAGDESAIRPMEYPVFPGMAVDGSSDGQQAAAEQEAKREEALARQLDAARREAIEQGKRMATAESSAWRQQRAEELARTTEAFRASRDEYLIELEKEVVQLALGIAARILHRESQMDPLLLSGAVRRALGQLADSTEVRLRVSANEQLWTDVVRLMPGLALRPQVVTDPDLPAGGLILESSLGTVDLSVPAQLREIERSFFDRGESRNEGPRGVGAGQAQAEEAR